MGIAYKYKRWLIMGMEYMQLSYQVYIRDEFSYVQKSTFLRVSSDSISAFLWAFIINNSSFFLINGHLFFSHMAVNKPLPWISIGNYCQHGNCGNYNWSNNKWMGISDSQGRNLEIVIADLFFIFGAISMDADQDPYVLIVRKIGVGIALITFHIWWGQVLVLHQLLLLFILQKLHLLK